MTAAIEVALSVLMLVSIVFLLYELRKFGRLHSKKYELPTEKIWEKFVGIRPEDMSESNLTVKVQEMEKKITHLKEKIDKQNKLTKKLVEELGN